MPGVHKACHDVGAADHVQGTLLVTRCWCSYMQRMHLLCRDFWLGRRPAGYLSLADVTTLCAQSDAL